MVLVHNTLISYTYSDKLGFRWFGPFQIKEVLDKGSYLIKELDGTAFQLPIHGNHLKTYHTPNPQENDDITIPSIFSCEILRSAHQDMIPEGQDFAVVID